MAASILSFGAVTDANDPAQCLTERGEHDLILTGDAVKLQTACPWAGVTTPVGGAPRMAYANMVMLLVPASQLTPAAKQLRFMLNAIGAPALNRLLLTLLDAGLSLDRVYEGFTSGTPGYSVWLQALKQAVADANPAQLAELTLDVTDFFLTEQPAVVNAAGYITFIDTTLVWGGEEGIVQADGDMMGAALLEFILGKRVLIAHRMGANEPYRQGTQKVINITGAQNGSAEDRCFHFNQSWKLWPEGLDSFESSMASRRASAEARLSYWADASPAIFETRLMCMLGTFPALAGGVCPTDTPRKIMVALNYLAKTQELITEPPEAVVEGCDRFLSTATLADWLKVRVPPQTTMEWVEAIIKEDKSRKRRREAAPTDGGGGGSAAGTGSGGAISKMLLGDLEIVTESKQYELQKIDLMSHHQKMGTESGYDRPSLLHRMLTGKTPDYLLPEDKAARDTLRAAEATRRPIALFHQLLARKYNAVAVVPELAFLEEVCNERVLASLLWRVAVSAYWTSKEPMPACLLSGELPELATALLKFNWGRDVDLVKMVDAKVLAVYHRADVCESQGDWKTDVFQLWRVAYPAQRIFELFTFDSSAAGEHVRAALHAPMTYSRLNVPVTLESLFAQGTCFSKFITGTMQEACEAYDRVRKAPSPNVTSTGKWEQPGSSAVRELTNFFAECDLQSARHRAQMTDSFGAQRMINLPYCSSNTSVPPQLTAPGTEAARNKAAANALVSSMLDPKLATPVPQKAVLAIPDLHVIDGTLLAVRCSDNSKVCLIKAGPAQELIDTWLREDKSIKPTNPKCPCYHTILMGGFTSCPQTGMPGHDLAEHTEWLKLTKGGKKRAAQLRATND